MSNTSEKKATLTAMVTKIFVRSARFVSVINDKANCHEKEPCAHFNQKHNQIYRHV
jgi:hypothetical protein